MPFILDTSLQQWILSRSVGRKRLKAIMHLGGLVRSLDNTDILRRSMKSYRSMLEHTKIINKFIFKKIPYIYILQGVLMMFELFRMAEYL